MTGVNVARMDEKITDVSGSIRLFSDVMKKLGIKQNGDELYEEFREFMLRVLVEMLVKIRRKIRCGIRAGEGEFCNFDF